MGIIKKLINAGVNSKLRKQLIISFIATSFSILLISSLFTYKGITNILKMRLEQSTEKQFYQFEYNIRTFVDEVDKISKMLLLDSKLQDFLEHKNIAEYDKIMEENMLFKRLHEIVGNYDYIESIYLFMEDGRILGSTASTNECLEDPGKENGFYKSDVYRLTKKEYLSLVWVGGKKSLDFDLYRIPGSRKNIDIISAARGVKSLYRSIQSATLVINIKESDLTSIYSNMEDPSSSLYIVDSRGKIISNIDRSKIGRSSLAYTKIDKNLKNGNFTLNQNSTKKQVFYLKLKDLGWTIISETDTNDYVKDILTMRNTLLFMFLISLIISLVLSLYLVFIITKPIKRITAAMFEVEKGSIGLTLTGTPENEFGMIMRQFNKMSLYIAELINENRIIEEKKRRQEIAALQLQINPHFLYNTLNTIKLMAAIVNAANIVESITILGNMMRSVFKLPSPMCTVEEEISYLKSYIKIMNFRYGEGIKMMYDIREDLIECHILRFIMQPLVENAICHGLAEKNHFGEIHVELIEEDGDIFLTISDNGVGMTGEKLTEIKESLFDLSECGDQLLKGIGVRNIHHRIRLHFGEKYGLEIESEKGKGTRIRVRLPKIQKS
jgi:Predicted signal transduction protein with a C-terminal ATPase domain